MADQVIWERTVDETQSEKRMQRFRLLFGIPFFIIVGVVTVTAGAANAIGAAILLAMLGGGWFTVIRFQGMSDRANPVMILDDGVLKLGRLEVVVADVTRFTTRATSIQTSLLGRFSRIDLGKAIFRLNEPGQGEPELVEFGWPNMQEAGVASVRAALEPIFDDLWVDPMKLVDESELPPSRARIRPRRGII